MKTFCLALCVCAILLSNGSRTWAENGPCQEDIAKFCKDVPVGKGGIMKCLKSHESELSAACQDHGEKMRAEREKDFEKSREVCKGDVEKFCKGVEVGEGRVIHCLMEHKKDLSEPCSGSFKFRK